jgi:hypothetical protein
MSKQKSTNDKKSATPPVASEKQTSAVKQEVSSEQIAKRAYELFLARGGQHGHHEQDWQQAERELRLGRQ